MVIRCDLCRKPLGPRGIVLRWKNHWPDRLITSVLQLHKGCDTHRWPADGYGHIEPAAMSSEFMSELIERSDGLNTHAKIQKLFDLFGYKGPPPPQEYCESIYPPFFDDVEDAPF